MALLFKNLLFTFVVPGTVAVYLPLLIARGEMAVDGAIGILADALLVVGGAIYGWCVWDFASFGGGTPAPIDAPGKLVVRGLYHYTRNPMYVGVLSVILGWALLFQSGRLLLYAAGVFTLFQCFVYFYEEPHLEKVFGEEYRAYRERVPRWLGPWQESG